MHVITNSRLNHAAVTNVSCSAAERIHLNDNIEENAAVDRIKMLLAAVISECELIQESSFRSNLHASLAITTAEVTSLWAERAIATQKGT